MHRKNKLSMIAKILSSSSSFNGVNYNEKKNESGKSELLDAKNFGELDEIATKEDYINYFKHFSNSNTRVKNPQFHAVLSCKGTEYTMDQMKNYAERWLEKMGYENQPYLIYGHGDTENNHVHIVSVRIDKEGNKISDKFERVRSQKALNEIMGVNLQKKAEEQYLNLSTYNYSNMNQFKLLLENSGWIVTEKDDKLCLIKGGEAQLNVSKDEVNTLIHNNLNREKNKERKKQITALLYKYKAGLSHIQLQELMSSKFGIEMVFHAGKGHTKPYGYTIIDHSSRSVFKGSEIMDLSKILQSPEKLEKTQACSNLVDTIFESRQKITLKDFREEMQKLGYVVDKYGQLSVEGEKEAVYKLSDDRIKELRYNQRCKSAEAYVVNNREEAAVLAKVLSLKIDDIKLVDDKKNPEIAYFYGQLVDRIKQGLEIDGMLAARKMEAVKVGDTTYFVDKKFKTIISDKELEYDRRLLDANKFASNSPKAAEILSKLYKVKAEDITLNKPGDDSYLDFYKSMMRDYLNGRDIDDKLKEKEIYAIKVDGDVYFVDTKHKNIINENEYDFSHEYNINKGVDRSDNFVEISRVYEAEMFHNIEHILSELARFNEAGIGSGSDTPNLDERKRRKRKKYSL